MPMTDVHPRLTKCFAAVFPTLPPADMPAATMESIAGWDSLASVTLLTVVEEEFATTIEPEELENLQSFEAYLRYLTGQPAAVNAR
jgi:acyl carrier protein